MKICVNEGCVNTVRTTSRGSRYCGACTSTKFKYGLTIPQRNKLLSDQNGLCKVCSRPIFFDGTPGSKSSSANIDHCHSSNKIRGVLCWPCNVALGKFNDDVEILKSAIIYLEGTY